MHPEPMTKNPDPVAPDHPIRLQSRTPLRSRRRMAAGVLSGLLALSCFAIPPAWAYKAGHGAADRPSGIPEYANIPAYLADANRNNHRHVKIGQYTLPREQVEAFHTANSLTDGKLIASFTNVAAYLEDSDRTNRLYADIKGTVYRVSDLEASNTARILSDTSLPDPVTSLVSSIDRFGTTAVGDGAQATAYDATALGDGARATGYGATALGDGTQATGGGAIAIGANVAATGASATVIGNDASARGDKAIVIGLEAAVTAPSLGAIAIGMESRTDGWKSMAIGAHARTHGNAAIAVGRSTQAYGSTSIALGRGALAHGPSVGVTSNGATSLGPGATALGMSATAMGKGAMAAKERDIALLPCVYGPDFYKSSHCSSFLTTAERANPNLRADTEQGETFRAGIQTRLLGVLNSRSAADYATALGHSSWAAGSHGSTAVGSMSRATGERSTALGATAKAGGLRSTAVGEASQAQGADTVAVGRNAVAGGLTVGKTYGNVGKYLADTTRTSHTNVRIDSNVYQVNALEAVTGLTQDNLPVALTVTAGGVAVGVSARAAGVNSIALGQGAAATGTNGIAIGQGVSAGPNEVVIGVKQRHSYRLPGLATSSGTRVVTVDSNGRLSTQAATSSSSRGASLRGAAALSSEVTALDRDTGTPVDAAYYEEAPAIGSGPGAPATAEQRRVVVQDTNRDGSVRLRTLDFGDLSGVDRRLSGVEQRVTTLSERLNKATAMSAALSALPNVVPGDKRFFLGVGAGHYSSEQAVAIGMSARVGRHVFVNAGAAVASGDNASVRGGVGVVW